MRARIALLMVLLSTVACATESRTKQQTPRKTVSATAATETPKPEFFVLEHVGYSLDDALEICFGFDGDGLASDPSGISGRKALEQAHRSIETTIMNDGREVLCMLQENVGSPGCTFKEGHWLHRLVKADGTIVKLENDLRNYRVHHGEIDAWLWQPAWMNQPYDFVGTTFAESCSGQ